MRMRCCKSFASSRWPRGCPSGRLFARPRRSGGLPPGGAPTERERLSLSQRTSRAFELIATQPGIGARARNPQKEGVRRLLLSRTGYHLYYQVNADLGQVEVLALWRARRGQEPAL